MVFTKQCDEIGDLSHDNPPFRAESRHKFFFFLQPPPGRHFPDTL